MTNSGDRVLTPKALSPSRSGSLYYLGIFLWTGSILPYLYVYYTGLGLTGQQVGWLATFSPMMTLLFATPLSALADRLHWRVRITQIAIAGTGLTTILLRYPKTFAGIAALMILMSICSSPMMAIADSLVARIAQRHGLNYGGMRLWGSFGYASSALVFGAIWQRLGFEPMFIVGFLLILPQIWVTGQLEEGPVKGQEERGKASELARDAGLVMLLIATFLVGIAVSLSMTFEGIYMRSLGGGNFLIGVMSACGAMAELPSMYFGQRIARRLRSANTVILAYGLMAGAYLGYVLATNPLVVPLFSIFKGLGFGLFFANTVQILNERAPEEWASTAQSLMTAGMFGLAPLIAGPLGGLIHDAISPAAVFLVAILALVLAGAVLWAASACGKLE